MYLRKLKPEDAPLMLEWMHDTDVTGALSGDFASKTLQNCLGFIEASADASVNLHMAIAADDDTYMGTVSLKQIDRQAGNAEFAITVRKEAMRKGYSWFAMVEILKIAFDKLDLNSVYWCVSEKNKRACRFYDKHKFHRALDISPAIQARYAGLDDLRWYCVFKGDDFQNSTVEGLEIASCRGVNIKTIPTLDAGELSFFEANHDIPFDIKRIYYISKVPEGARRGFHAHKKLKQLLFCPYGCIQLILDDGTKREEITLQDPSVGIVIEKPVWREMLWLQKDSVLCVAASDYYEVEDYIRNYDDFIAYIQQENKS